MAAYRPGQSTIKLTAVGGATSNWPVYNPATSVMPKIGSGAINAAGAAAGVAAAGLAAGLRNASMGAIGRASVARKRCQASGCTNLKGGSVPERCRAKTPRAFLALPFSGPRARI